MALTATQTTTLTTDIDADAAYDPGETVTTTVTVTNTAGLGDATGVSFSEDLNGMTLVRGALNVSPLALDDAFTTVGNTQLVVGGTAPSSPAVTVSGSLFANDHEFANDLGVQDQFTLKSVAGVNFVSGSVTAATTGQGTVTVNADGTFTYVPKAGYSGTDTFTYTLTDDGIDGVLGTADDLTGTATVSITVTGEVWYVDGSFTGTSEGTSTNPF